MVVAAAAEVGDTKEPACSNPVRAAAEARTAALERGARRSLSASERRSVGRSSCEPREERVLLKLSMVRCLLSPFAQELVLRAAWDYGRPVKTVSGPAA